jgi:hypothetical protein
MKHKEEILRLREEGKSYRQIQVILGCSKGTIAYHLGSGQKEKSHKRYRDTRASHTEKLRSIKEESGCVDCKQKYPHFMLQFDHLPQYEKLDVVANIARRYSWEKALKEIEKCEIVCANCHSIRTWERNNLKSGEKLNWLERQSSKLKVASSRLVSPSRTSILNKCYEDSVSETDVTQR